MAEELHSSNLEYRTKLLSSPKTHGFLGLICAATALTMSIEMYDAAMSGEMYHAVTAGMGAVVATFAAGLVTGVYFTRKKIVE